MSHDLTLNRNSGFNGKRKSRTLVWKPPVPPVLVLDPQAPDEAGVDEAVRVLRSGGLLALPTETVYGLGARAFDETAIARVFQVKGRPAHHPLIAHVLDEAQAQALAAAWPERASRLARAFWPGPLTLVVDRAVHVPAAVAGGGESIALRAPSHLVARAVIAALGEPVAAPSANRYQALSPTTARHVIDQLGDGVDLVLDAGACASGIESTVVDVRGATPRVLRPGALDLVALRDCVPELEACVERAGPGAPRASPGMEPRHYAPRAPLSLASGGHDAWRAARELASKAKRVGLVVREANDTAPSDPSLTVRVLPGDAVRYARLLYRTLHELDDEHVDAIVVEDVPHDDAWWAIADRLRRASHGG
jgi:L-threonylcarbamoyladenylate synthase